MPIVSLRDLEISGKRVFVRVDFNVPLDKSTGDITDSTRITAALPTIEFILERGGCCVLASHLGRPDGQKNDTLSLRPIAEKLSELLGRPVKFLGDCAGPEVEAACAALKPGEIVMLENLRFHIEEEGVVKRADGTKVSADPAKIAAFRASLSRLGDVYVNDAFGAAHRAHSSIVGVATAEKAAGLLLERELNAFAQFQALPKDGSLTILGGAKVGDKLPLILGLLDSTSRVIIAGGMAFPFLKSAGMDIGGSRCEAEDVKAVPEILEKAKERGVRLHFPCDFVCGQDRDATVANRLASRAAGLPGGSVGLDIGPQSRALFGRLIARCSKLLWNGPPGVFERPAFAAGTRAMARSVAKANSVRGIFTLIGGGDTALAAKTWGITSKVTHVSTGGGAGLALLAGHSLPGVTFLEAE